MAQLAELVNVRQLLSEDTPFGPDEVQRLEELIAGPQVGEFRQELRALQIPVDSAGDAATEAQLLRVGVGLYLLGQHSRAERYLSQVTDNLVGSFYYALVLSALERHAEAEAEFERAAKLGYDRIECTLRRAGTIRAQGRLEEAESTLRSAAKEGAKRAEYSFQMGCILADRGDTFGAIEYFERAVDMDPEHSRALFWLAAENALRGNDDEAIRLYEQSLARPPYYLGSLFNLGLLYEDRENYAAAAYCFRRILDFDPTNARARLYLKDIEGASEMYYDEDTARYQARLEQLLGRPLGDFELSVRSRNCLEGMGIYTLGDLTRVTEAELLAGKNFGESSLHELREMLASHGLRIGQNVEYAGQPELLFEPAALSPQEQSLLNKSVAQLNLSVRARKCMARLGINTIGQLVARTADELLSSRNFGVTSLNEIRSKLGELNMKLRND